MRRGLMKSIHGFISGKGGGHSTFGTAQGNCQGAAQVLGGRRLFAKHIAGHVTLRTIQHTNQSIHSHTNRPYTQREHSFTQSIYSFTRKPSIHTTRAFIHAINISSHIHARRPSIHATRPSTHTMEPSNKPTRIYPDRHQSTQPIHPSIHSRKETTRPSDTPIHPSIHSFTQGDHETIRHTNQSIQSHNGTRQTGAEGRWTTAVTPR